MAEYQLVRNLNGRKLRWTKMSGMALVRSTIDLVLILVCKKNLTMNKNRWYANTRFFHKNNLYKKHQAEIRPTKKNILGNKAG